MSGVDAVVRSVQGRVLSAKGEKSITVALERVVPHPVYGKYVRKTSKVRAHDEQSEAGEGDLVLLTASRPVSKTKTWRVLKVLEKAGG